MHRFLAVSSAPPRLPSGLLSCFFAGLVACGSSSDSPPKPGPDAGSEGGISQPANGEPPACKGQPTGGGGPTARGDVAAALDPTAEKLVIHGGDSAFAVCPNI